MPAPKSAEFRRRAEKLARLRERGRSPRSRRTYRSASRACGAWMDRADVD